MRNLCKQYYDMHQIPFSTSSIKTRHAAALALPRERRVDALVALVHGLMLELPPVMHLWLVDTFRAPSAWFDARLAFTRSNAVMSMIGMAVGLGDRHLENILVDSTTGSVMHVDFGCLFDHGLNLETPERVPFRLTQNILHTMGPCGGNPNPNPNPSPNPNPNPNPNAEPNPRHRRRLPPRVRADARAAEAPPRATAQRAQHDAA